MKTLPSRRRLLPRPAKRTVSRWWIVSTPVVAAALYGFFASLAAFIVLGCLVALGLFGWVVSIVHTRRLRRLAASRPDDSICTFARAFDVRSTDTAIVRAVYEELQHYFRWVTPAFPFRPTDHFDTELKLDPEDLDDLAPTIAHRAQRTFDRIESNPLFGHVHTIYDLVRFFTHQPPTGTA